MEPDHTPPPPTEAALAAEVMQGCILTRARRLSRVITGIYDQALRPYDVNGAQFSLLVLIAGMDGASRAEIGRFNHQERSTSTRNLQLLLTNGWAVEAGAAGGRRRPIVLSEQGKALLRAATPAWREAQAAAQRLLGQQGRDALFNMAHNLPPG
ncbi:MarR family transcriptional regulator [Duganella sp. FT92W]|uniref:MarR family transcriptional regulator n=1 Tax=Pseudoduganella rivuli TaxID=2666085 RepID=A0A7X2IUF5_9BURK|nr:MarR family transcriptional regulator [Pseudoduganella rivuli]